MELDKTRYYLIQTFGCQMNVADSEKMEILLREDGFQPCFVPEVADLILINGCSVREKAVQKALSALGRAQVLKRKDHEKKPWIGLVGCVGQLEKNTLFEKFPFVDFVFGPDAIDRLPQCLRRLESGNRKFVDVTFDQKMHYSTQTKLVKKRASAFVNIMKGCDKFCSYCIVPFTRGREKSRTIDEVIQDVRSLVAQGVREITFLGQNVNSFGKGNPNGKHRVPISLKNPIGPVGPRGGEENFPQLLYAIDQDKLCKGLKWIRFTSSHPLDFSNELLNCYGPRGVKKLAQHLHLPVQSGSNLVLQKMGRHHKIEVYIEQIEKLKTLCTDVGLSTDFIVGFPGETQSDFEQTLKLMKRLAFDQVYAFMYSPRPGTRAARLKDDVSDQEKKTRLHQLLRLQQEISFQKKQSLIGSVFEVLVEGASKKMGAQKEKNQVLWMGRTTHHHIVHFLAPAQMALKGAFVKVQLLSATALSFQAKLLEVV